MPRESDLRAHLRDLIVKDLRGFVTNHEDKFTKGIPDTSFAISHMLHRLPGHYFGTALSGWIELKHEHSMPKMWRTELRIGMRTEQHVWIRERWKVIHDTFIMVRVGDDIYMFTGEHVTELYNPISRDRFESIWIGKWNKKIDKKEFLELLCETIR